MRIPILSARREARERAEFLARQQRSLNPALRARIIVATGHALAIPETGPVEVEGNASCTNQAVFWVSREGLEVSAQRQVWHTGRTDAHEIFIEGVDPNAGPWLSTSADEIVRFNPGAGFDSAEQFLAWFEAETGMGVAS
jgi:hypothetical protein